MKRTRIISALTVGVGVVCATSCSSVQKKNTVAMDRNEVRRTLASTLDAGTVGPNGEVILFYKSGRNIVVQQCGDYTVLNQRSDCTTKPGTSVAKVPVDEFKNRLKEALKLPVGDYNSAMQKKIDLYRQTKIDPAEIARIQAFIDAYGAANVDPKYANIADAALAVKDINALVDKLVDQVIGNSALQKFVYSTDKQGFEFNILRTYIKTPGLSATFAKISAGTFQMGSSGSETNRSDDEVLHSVTISHDFEMEVTDVTQLQWFLVMGYNPSYFKSQNYCQSDYININGTDLCPNNPVEQVSWDDTQSFIAKLNQGNDGYTYRLPTEAEWEYAARAGTQTAYYFGDDPAQLDANGWYTNNSGSQTHAVGGKTANAFGLYDMAGNVWEWAQDYYGPYSNSRVTDPTGASSGSTRVVRGGGWYGYGAQDCRSAVRGYVGAGGRRYVLGFRLVRTQ
jgi:formylglycine-generating enzyme required for sulfatase activity